MSQSLIDEFIREFEQLKTNDAGHPMSSDLIEAFRITRETAMALLSIAAVIPTVQA